MSDRAIEEIIGENEALPDYTQLGGRLFITDGRHANKVVMDAAGNMRAMGAREQMIPLGLTWAENASGPLVRGRNVTYAIRRVITAHGLEVAGGMMVEYLSIPLDEEAEEGTDPAAVAVSMTVIPYEFSTDNVDSISYQIFRSKKWNTQLLYLCATLTQAEVEALTDGIYTDLTADKDMPINFTINLDSDGMELTIPPCRYIRAWRGVLICGGFRKRAVTVTGAAASAVLTVAEDAVTVDDIGCYMAIDGEPATYQIVAVSGTSVTLDSVLESEHADEYCMLWRDDDVVYVSRALPGNIEVYSAENGRLISNSGSDNMITGIASNGSYAYIFRHDCVEIVAGTAAGPTLEPFPASPPGCRSHATIIDKYAPFVIYYAGACGVWLISGSEAKKISTPVDSILTDGVAHSQDKYTHAVYDPTTNYYWLFLFSTKWEDMGIRMPDMVLVYDTLSGVWTRGEMCASRSGLWRNSSGELVPVIGIPSGVAQIGKGDTDGPCQVTGTIDECGDDWFTLSETDLSGNLDSVIPGMPIFFGDDCDAPRRMVKYCDSGLITIYGTMPVKSGNVSIGAIRWKVVTPEIGLSGAFDRTLRLGAVSVAHGRESAQRYALVEVKTIGTLSTADADSQRWEGRMDLATRTVSRFDGKATGLRGQSMQMTLSGQSAPAVIKGIHLSMEQASR